MNFGRSILCQWILITRHKVRKDIIKEFAYYQQEGTIFCMDQRILSPFEACHQIVMEQVEEYNYMRDYLTDSRDESLKGIYFRNL